MSDNSLRGLYADASTPAELKPRVLRSFRATGAAGRPRQRVFGRGAYLLPLAAALMIGFVAGRVRVEPAAPPGSEFLLLLYEDAGYRDDRPVGEIIAEYSGWADSLGRTGALVLGEKLADSRYEIAAAGVDASGGGAPSPTGLFIVRAESDERATEIARASPHIRYGGRIVVRPIERAPGGGGG